MVVPASYGPTLRFDRAFRRDGPEFAYALRTGAPLMVGWTVLLVWADRKPLERRGVLPITIAPVIAGLMANDTQAVRSGRLSRLSVAPVRALQVALVALFGYSFLKAQSAERGIEGERPWRPPADAGPFAEGFFFPGDVERVRCQRRPRACIKSTPARAFPNDGRAPVEPGCETQQLVVEPALSVDDGERAGG
jgi:hypothetical protein